MVYRRFGAPVSAAIVGFVVSGTANADGCSNRTVSGSHGAQLTGSAGDQSFAEVVIFTTDGKEMSRDKISSI
jgi:hypothetical protein